MKKSAILIFAIRQSMSASHTILYIYRNGFKTWEFGKETPQICVPGASEYCREIRPE